MQGTPVQPEPAPLAFPTVLEDSDHDSRSWILPASDPDDGPYLRSWYPKPWQDLIDHAQSYILNYMVFVDPFPHGSYSQTMAREDMMAAWSSFSLVSPHFLDPDSCKLNSPPTQRRYSAYLPPLVKDHRVNLGNLVCPHLFYLFNH